MRPEDRALLAAIRREAMKAMELPIEAMEQQIAFCELAIKNFENTILLIKQVEDPEKIQMLFDLVDEVLEQLIVQEDPEKIQMLLDMVDEAIEQLFLLIK